ncbi:hypothetical protein GZH79_05710 [Loktanella sp. SALINAS62]|nr:hypothetical protein [Loktanella sp. SALINAS62]
MAAGTRPGWIAAWGPVVLDALALAVVLAVVLAWVSPVLLAGPVWIAVIALFGIVFVPVQVVLILSALWAAKSRGQIETEREP